MRIGPYEISVRKSRPLPYGEHGHWLTLHGEYGDPQGFQKDLPPISFDRAASNTAFYSCITLIAADIGKLRFMLIEYDADGLWTEVQSNAFSPVLRRPNRYQNHIQFKEWWITSKLMKGNAYALKRRDSRGVVVALYLLDPRATWPYVAPDGDVYYRLSTDNLTGVLESVMVPASEIIHDRMNCLFHPLCGTSPIYACGAPAEQGLRIQNDSSVFFGNSASPSGILTSPGQISTTQRDEYRKEWKTKFTGTNAGNIAVLGGGLKFEPMRMTSQDAQLIEQEKFSAEKICSTFHVPAYKVGVGAVPLNNNVDALNQQYYDQCLQSHIEHMEQCLLDGLGLDMPIGGRNLAVMLDLDGLLRMDQKTQMDTLRIGVEGALVTPNEGRKKLNKKPLKGGDTVYLQQQDYSIEAIADRDANKPFAKPPDGAPALPAPTPDQNADDAAKRFMATMKRLCDAEVQVA